MLLERDAVPPALAAARLAERDVSRARALSWAARLGLPAGEPLSAGGTLGPCSGAG
ncbi:hypothetical protein [Streptomyces sp. CBMA123]|uniref:hypothetical protein n=1 Tax=Streptomyces sp. CBMA123 TaxID=1896313 RepID=UPI0016618A9C|nr:hypothetical protein [Streptomyces sp. CBMA123]